MDENEINLIIEKSRKKIAVYNMKTKKIITPQIRIMKIVASIMLCVSLGGGVICAGNLNFEGIWKEPKSYKLTLEMTQEEIENCISEEEAKKIGEDYLQKIGLIEEKIQTSELEKSLPYYKEEWNLNTQNVTLSIDGKTGKIKGLRTPLWNFKIPYNYGIDRVEARKVAIELLEKYKRKEDTGEYELVKLTRNMETDEASYIWYAVFYKKYGDLLNENESIDIGWIPTINGLYSISFEDGTYEDNEVVISKEEAIKIATQKDKQIETNKIIEEIIAEESIQQMNESVYLRENFKESYENHTIYKSNYIKIAENTYTLKNDAVKYRTEERVRRVWTVVIKYQSSNLGGAKMFSYYVDCTTGEIIGGQLGNALEEKDNLKNDPYNLIEK